MSDVMSVLVEKSDSAPPVLPQADLTVLRAHIRRMLRKITPVKPAT